MERKLHDQAELIELATASVATQGGHYGVIEGGGLRTASGISDE